MASPKKSGSHRRLEARPRQLGSRPSQFPLLEETAQELRQSYDRWHIRWKRKGWSELYAETKLELSSGIPFTLQSSNEGKT